jgi:hypothetical protein
MRAACIDWRNEPSYGVDNGNTGTMAPPGTNDADT